MISGRVTDTTGGVPPGVTITVRNTATNVTSTLAPPTGCYTVSRLQPGVYEIDAELMGSKEAAR